MEPDVFFGKKPFCRLSEALEAAADIAQNADDNVDVVISPPEPSEAADEEGGDYCMGSASVKHVSVEFSVSYKTYSAKLSHRLPFGLSVVTEILEHFPV
ncbi:hypothetical protein MRX96_046731 [Rhipicephalus microplus]